MYINVDAPPPPPSSSVSTSFLRVYLHQGENAVLPDFSYFKSTIDLCYSIVPGVHVMTQQYVGHMTEDRYGWIAQLVEHPPGTR